MNANISVIIPAHNAAETLPRTLDSLLKQTCPDWEAIIVDDGSEDNTAAIAHQATAQDSRIRVVSQPNGGVSAARNTGAQLAQYEWLLFLDADDEIAGSYVAKMSAEIEKAPALDAVYCDWVRVAPDGSWVAPKQLPDPADLPTKLAYYFPSAIHACVIKRAAFVCANGFDTSLKTCEDWDLWQRIVRRGAQFGSISEVLAYYHMRQGSLSNNGHQLFIDGLRVLSQGHAADPRISDPHPDFAVGLSADRLTSPQINNLRFNWGAWSAGLMIGSGEDASPLLQLIEGNSPSLAPHLVADALFEAIPMPTCSSLSNWWQLWESVSQPLRTFLSALEKTSEAEGFAQRVTTILERKILENAVDAPLPLQIGRTYGVLLEVTQPVVDIIPPMEIDRLYGFVTVAGHPLGSLELPICDGRVSRLVLKDCMAAQFYWQILEHFYEAAYYQEKSVQADASVVERSLHDQIGWTTFLQDLWAHPNWSQADFYDASRLDNSFETLQLETNELILEVSHPLPNIEVSSADLKIILTVGGIAFSQIVVPTDSGKVSAQKLRAALTLAGGIELCRVSVREAYIGQSTSQPATIRERLKTLSQQRVVIATSAQATQSSLVSEASEEVSVILVLAQRHQLLGGSCSRWASLPTKAAKDMSAMAKAVGEVIAHSPDVNHPIKRLIYAPDALSFHQLNQPQKADWNPSESATVQTGFNNRDYFETLFAAEPDPWKYTSPYEQTKYEQTLSLLPNKRLRALELACAEGHFTVQLAPCVKSLIATDISQIAAERTAQKCAQFSHVHCQQLDMVGEALPGKFELIVCSEVLYYVGGWEALQSTARKIANALEAGGYFLTAHANLVVDEPDRPGYNWDHPFGAKGIGDTFQQVKSLRLVKELWTPLYRIQLFQKSARNWFFWRKHSPVLIKAPQPAPPPDAVAAHVLWEGGETVKWNMQPAATEQLPILMYHRVAPDGAEALKQWRTSPEAFAEQLRYLRDAGYYTVSLETWGEAIAHKQPLPGRAVILTFDDGYLDFFTYAHPILQEYGFSATVFLVSEQVGKSNQWDTVYGEHVPLMDWSQIRQMRAQGIEFGSHTATHRPLTALSAAEIVREGARSRTLITQELGIPVQTIAYPYGDTDLAVQHLIGACGYTVGVSCQSGHSCFKDSPLSLPRIEITGSDNLDGFVRKLNKS